MNNIILDSENIISELKFIRYETTIRYDKPSDSLKLSEIKKWPELRLGAMDDNRSG